MLKCNEDMVISRTGIPHTISKNSVKIVGWSGKHATQVIVLVQNCDLMMSASEYNDNSSNLGRLVMSIARRGMLALVGALGIGAMVASAPGVAQAWEPQKPVEFVIMAGQGGGADKMARLMQAVIEKNDWSSKPLTPINKPGGSGAEALVHLHRPQERKARR